MANISPEDVLKFIAKNSNRSKNSKGKEFGWSDAMGIWTYLTVNGNETTPFEVSICTSEDDITEFIQGFKLEKIEDMLKLLSERFSDHFCIRS